MIQQNEFVIPWQGDRAGEKLATGRPVRRTLQAGRIKRREMRAMSISSWKEAET